MSGPPNINNNHTNGSGRGWLRTPPPTYFRSPSPWVPPGSTPTVMQTSPVTFSGTSQMNPNHTVSSIIEQQSATGSRGSMRTEIQYSRSNVRGDGYEKQQLFSIPPGPEYQFNRPPSVVSQVRSNTPLSYGYANLRPISPAIQRPYVLNTGFEKSVHTHTPIEGAAGGVPMNADSSSQYVIFDYSGECGPSTAEIIANQSQDYVDEKLAEYQATIHLLQDEQERVQKKTFVNWINSFLCKRNPPLKIQDLIQDLKDGTKLLALLEVLSGERLPMEKGKVLRRPHYLSNINTALQFLTSKRIKLVNINPSDIVDGRPAVVLGLIWTIILYFQIEENSRILHYLNENLSGSVSSLDSGSTSHIPSPSKSFLHGASPNITSQAMPKQGPKKTLLGWVNNALPKSSGLEVRDFGTSWRDGFAFLSLIDAIKTNVINIAEMKKYNNRYRLDTAFNIAETELGIARLLDAEDVDVGSPDEKSIMTYVAQFLHKYPDVKNMNSKSESEQELLNLLEWLRSAVFYYDSMNGSYPNNYELYEKMFYEKSEKHNAYKKVKNIYASKITPEVQELNNLWPRLETHLQQWLWFLDCNLSDQFGVIGLWLCNGEKILNDDDIPNSMNEETASLISKKLEAHKQFFVAYYEVLETFNELKTTSLVRAIPENQLNNIHTRLIQIEPRARQRRIKLKFLEHKCCLIAFLNLLENKINSVKYNNEDVVRQSLDQLKNFVTKNQIMQEFEKALVDMRQVIEEYKIEGNISKKEVYNIDLFLRDIEDRWKNVSSRLICTETMLEDVLTHWQRWKSFTVDIQKWIISAYRAMSAAEDDKIDFFQSLNSYKEKIEMLSDTFSILKSTCDMETSINIEKQFKHIMSQWEQIFQNTKQYLHVGDILQHRLKFKTDAARLNEWIQKAESILAKNNLKDSGDIKRCETEIKQIACEIESMEDLFKSISKSFQILIKEYSRDEVDKMMTLMKRDKEALVCIRAQIPLKLHLFHQLLTQQEALEAGHKEISDWLDEAENLLISYAFSNDPQQTKTNLVNHKSFFSRVLYYKSMLESKNNVYQNLLKLTNKDKSINVNDLSVKLKQLNDRFAYVINNANDWEYKLQENIKVWEGFQSSLNKVENFLRQADAWQNATIPLEKKADVEAQSSFFTNFDQSIINSLESHTEQLLKYLPPNEQQHLIHKVELVQKQWSDVISKIPQYLLKLEFRSYEIKFYNLINAIEKELNAEEQSFNCNDNFDAVLERNEEFFKINDLQLVESVLASLENTNYLYMEKFPNDRALFQPYQNANDKWVALSKRIENVKNILHKIPAQWAAYHSKFNEMSDWMNRVDASLKQILTEKESMEQFEQEKIAFQKICCEADAKREDMKWLVKTLDFLLSHTNEDQANKEQDKIEKLITQYKTLIPIIETTMIKTEIFAKCYTYRREAQEICELLDRIRMQTNDLPAPESVKRVAEMIEEQNYSIQELDNQRAHIMKMLQRGKDLNKNSNAPKFIAEEIQKLDQCWNSTYNDTAEKLRALNSLQKIWNDYNVQKAKIVSLLNNAETELRSVTPLQTDPKSVSHDLESKKQLVLNLRQASSKSLIQLNDLCHDLGISLPPVAKQVIEKETHELEKRIDSTMNYVEKRVEYLEDYNDKWNEYKQRLDSLKSWASNVYPKMVAAIKQPHITPEDRVVKTNQLENVLNEKIKILDKLCASASDLASKEGNLGEMKRLKSEVVRLQSTFSEMNKAINIEKRSVNQDLDMWQEYNQEIEKIKIWILQTSEAAEIRSSKVTQLHEANELLTKLEGLNTGCESQLLQVQTMVKKCNAIKYGVKPTEDLEKCYMNLNEIHENLQHFIGKITKLIYNWSGLEKDLQKIDLFLNEADDRYKKHSLGNIRGLQIDKLEDNIKALKLFNNEINDQQAKLISISHVFEQMSSSITDEGNSFLKNKLNSSRGILTRINENVRTLLNERYEQIVIQQNFNARMTDFSNWMDQIRTSLSELDKTAFTEVDLAFQNVQYLIQQHANKRELFNDIYCHVKQYSLSSSVGDNSILSETFSSLSSNYQGLESCLQKYRNYLQSWSEFMYWHQTTREHIISMKDNLLNFDHILEVELLDFKVKINEIKEQINEWRLKMIKLEHQPCVQFYDQKKNVVNALELIVDLENKLDSIKLMAESKLKEILDVKEKVEAFKTTQTQIISNMNNISDQFKQIIGEASLNNIHELVEKLTNLNKQIAHESTIQAQARLEGQLIVKQDKMPSIAIQESLSVLDKELDNIKQITDDTLEIFTCVRDSYVDFNQYNLEFHNELDKVNTINNSTALIFDDKPSLVKQLELLKQVSESMKKIKKTIDLSSKKGNEVVKNFRTYNAEDCDKILGIIRQNNDEFKNNLEILIDNSNALDQKLALYRQVEELSRDLITWLDATKDKFSRVLENPSEIDYKISSYKSELPIQEAFRENFNGLLTEFKCCNNNVLPKDLLELDNNLNGMFEQLDLTVSKLSDLQLECAREERNLKDQIKSIIEKLYKTREEILHCEDLTSNNTKQLHNLEKIRKLRKELNLIGVEIADLKNKFISVESKYDSIKEGTISKEVQNLDQRFGIVLNSLNEIENKLNKLVEKSFRDKVAILRRMVCSLNEKLKWCNPESCSDKYNLETKKSTLDEIIKSIDKCEVIKNELTELLKSIVVVINSSKVEHLGEEKLEVERELEQLVHSCNRTASTLTSNICLWQKYEEISGDIIKWLKEMEQKNKMETIMLIDLGSLKNTIVEVKNIRSVLAEFEPKLQSLHEIGDQINEINPDSRALNLVQHLQARYNAFSKYFSALIDRLLDVDMKSQKFTDKHEEAKNCIQSLKKQLLSEKDYKKLSDLRTHIIESENLINDACSFGEHIYAEVNSDCREKIRQEIHALRTSYNSLSDECNAELKMKEAEIMNKKSIEESYSQILKWLLELEKKIAEFPKLYSALQDKKSALFNCKTMLEDARAHGGSLEQLNKKIQSLFASDMVIKLQDSQSKLNSITEDLTHRIDILEDSVKNHELYHTNLEKSKDWLMKLQAQTIEVFSGNELNKPRIEEDLMILDNTLSEEEAVLDGINECYNQFTMVMGQTHELGHSDLLRVFENDKHNWLNFFEKCRSNKERLMTTLKNLLVLSQKTEDCLLKLATFKHNIKEISCMIPMNAQQNSVVKLNDIKNNIESYGNYVSNLLEECQNMKSNGELSNKAFQVQNEYRNLTNLCSDAILKAEAAIHDQSDFNKAFDNFRKVLSANMDCLEEYKQLVGDLNILQERQMRLKELSYKRLDDSNVLEELIARGEKLCTQTSPDGRELVRHRMSEIRQLWDKFSDDLEIVIQKVDHCLMQFGEFSLQQEQLSKWLKDIECSMKANAELKANIQDKRAQYQNHRLMHQEILSQNALLDTVCSKAQQLLTITRDHHLESYLVSIKDTYKNIVQKSNELLDHLNNSVELHNQYSNAYAKLKKWICEEKDKVAQFEDLGGEKNEINKRIGALNNLKINKSKGVDMMNQLMICFENNKPNTAPQGISIASEEIESAKKDFTELYTYIDELIEKQKLAILDWAQFDKDLEELTKWCRSMEVIFREQPLFESLAKKKSHHQLYRNNSNIIIEKQKTLDEFVTNAQTLFSKTGVEKIKFYINQLINRYQLLNVLSKEVVNRAQSIVTDHEHYEEKLEECNSNFLTINDMLAKVEAEKMSPVAQSILQNVEIEKEKVENSLSRLSMVGEKVITETSTVGRDKIREDMSNIKDHWDHLVTRINRLKKQFDVRTVQWSSYQDILQQVLVWLDQFEKKIDVNEIRTWCSSQEIRSKLFKYKAYLQEIMGQNRMIDSLNDKAAQLVECGDEEVSTKMQSVNERFAFLKMSVSNMIDRLSQSLTLCNQFNERQKSFLDEYDTLLNELKQLSDVPGSKKLVLENFRKVEDLYGKIPEITEGINTLKNLVTDNDDLISSVAKKSMEQDLTKIQNEFNKLTGSIDETKRELERRMSLWDIYQQDLEQIGNFLTEIEDSMKGYTLKNFLVEKQEQHEYYQMLNSKLKQNYLLFDKLTDKSLELVQSCGDSKISLNMQQMKSRMQSIESTVKEITKKCEQAFEDHKMYKMKYNECQKDLDDIKETFGSNKLNHQANLENSMNVIKGLIEKQNCVSVKCSSVSDMGEMLYASTALKGQQAIRIEIQELLLKFEQIFDEINSYFKTCEARLAKVSGLNEKFQQFRDWLHAPHLDLSLGIIHKPTLDEKITQHQCYADLIIELKSHVPELNNLKDLVDNLNDRDIIIDSCFNELKDSFNFKLEEVQKFANAYEQIVSNHRQYCKAVLETSDYIDANHNTIELWGETDLDQVSLLTNMDRLIELKKSILLETNRIEQIRQLGQATIPDTSDDGQSNIRTQIDISQQEWEGLLAAIDSTIEKISAKITEWSEFEKLRTDCMNWMRNVDSSIHSVDLKSSLDEKKNTLEYLKSLQGEVKAKELEIDSFTEKAQQLYRGYLSNRSSQISELTIKYQQTASRVKELSARWQQYVINHQELETQFANHKQWLSSIKEKLNYCADLATPSEKDLQSKLKVIHDLVVNKDEGNTRIQNIIDLSRQVLACTTSLGHEAINRVVADLQDEWSSLTLRMVDVKSQLDDAINQWSGFLDQVNDLKKKIDWMENELKQLSEFQNNMAEKRAQLDKIKHTEEKVRIERIEIEPLKKKAAEMSGSGQQTQAASTAQQILGKFDYIADQITKLLTERGDQYRDHRLYKEAFDDLTNWINRAREKLPCAKQQSLSDKLTIENAMAPLDSLMKKRAQGELLVEHLVHTGEVVLASTSAKGKETIKADINQLKNSFETLFKDIDSQKQKLEQTLALLREYKEEYERLSEWLQQIDIIVKNHKLATSSNLQEKEKQVKDMHEIITKLEKGQDDLNKFNAFAAPLLQSHLDSYIGNQLRHLNSRYQVQVNIAKDVLKKVESNFEVHKEYKEHLAKANHWIDNAKEIVRYSIENVENVSKENLEKRLEKVIELIQQREQGQQLVNHTVNTGEKVVKTTKSDGKEVINNEIKEVQNAWDRLVKKMSTAKVHLETSLLQWADYSSSYNHLQQWIQDRESKLQRVCEQKVVRFKTGNPSSLSIGLNERRANLRQANDIVQDIVSFEPMIQSVASKASDLHQTSPASEISNKYETLSKQAKELFAKQKETVELHQAFIDSSNDFAAWIRNAKEGINKCSDYRGDKESLVSKMSQLKILDSDVAVGQKKLQKALEQAEVACRNVDSEECEAIEKEVAILQDEFDNYCIVLKKIATSLENGIVRWTEYDDHYKKALNWIDKYEQVIQSSNKMQNSLEEKKFVLEEFQEKLQTLFDWQKELDNLNIKAQILLDICADTRVSNGVTQLTTKYNVLLSIAKEIMRRLELHYQEHQQHNAFYGECQDWLERMREKLNECDVTPHSIVETQAKLNIIKGIRQSLEQGQNKLRYLFELKEKIVLSTESEGASKLAEDTENLKTEYESLMVDIQDIRQKLLNHLAHLEDIGKLSKMLSEWIEEVQNKLDDEPILIELSDKRVALEKYRAIHRETGNYNDIVEKIKAKVSENDNVNSETIQKILSDYQTLVDKVASEIEHLESQVNYYEKFNQGQQALYDWLKNTRSNTEKLSDYHGDKEQIELQINKIKDIELSFSEGKVLLENAQELSNKLLQIVGNEGRDTVKQDILQSKSDWEDVEVLTKTVHQTLNEVLGSWESFFDKSENIQRFIANYKEQIQSLSNDKEEDQDSSLQKLKHILDIVTTKKNEVDELNDVCEVLMEKSTCCMVRDRTIDIQKSYSALLTNLHGLISQLQKNVMSHTEFIYYKNELDKWINNANEVIKGCQNIPKDNISLIKQEIINIQTISNTVPQGQKLFEMLQDSFTKSSYLYSEAKQTEMFQIISSFRDAFDTVVLKINANLDELNAKRNRLEIYDDLKNKVTDWLNLTEGVLESIPETHGEMGEVKSLLDKLKHIETEISFKRTDIENIQQEAVSLFDTTKSSLEMDRVTNLQQRNFKLNEKCVYIIKNLELELQEQMLYYQNLQEIEKWLLQISFQLMAHNSLYIHNREQTQEQIAQHEKLLDEIQRYQVTIDDFNIRGQAQIERYVLKAPEIKNRIESQIKNIKDSYTSLLNTSVQIKNRLYDSLNKFQEYENTLEDILHRLDEFEPEITQLKQIEVPNYDVGKETLEKAQEYHNKLQIEKSRLIHAVQACEAATASISRPSSPLESAHQVIPEKELMVRARLEDLIDEVQSWIEDLISTINNCERQYKQRLELDQWIFKHDALITDWLTKPFKLRMEAAEQEMRQMNDLLKEISAKKELIEQDQITLDKLQDLQNRLEQAIDKKMMDQSSINKYKKNHEEIQIWFDDIINQIDSSEKGSGLNCKQKLENINNIKKKIEDNCEIVKMYKQNATQASGIVSNLDAQQIAEQTKSVDRRYQDVRKRLDRKIDAINHTNNTFNKIYTDVNNIYHWLLEKQKSISQPYQLDADSKSAELQQQFLKSLLKEVEEKQSLLDTIGKRFASIQPDLETDEKLSLENDIRKANDSSRALIDCISKEVDKIVDDILCRKNMQNNLEMMRSWIRTKQNDINKASDYVPLLASNVNSTLELCKRHAFGIQEFRENAYKDVTKQVQEIMKECSTEGKDKLTRQFQLISDKLQKLSDSCSEKISALELEHKKRTNFENHKAKLLEWFNAAETVIAGDLRPLSLDILKNQRDKLDYIYDENESIKKCLKEIEEYKNSIVPSLNEPDNNSINNQTKTLTEKWQAIDKALKTKLKKIHEHIQEYEEALRKINQCAEFLTSVQARLRDMNKPVASKIENIQDVLMIYETILGDLKERRIDLNTIMLTNIPQLRENSSKLEESIFSMEEQLRRLKTTLGMRDQFVGAINEVVKTISIINTDFNEIDQFSKNVNERLEKYKAILHQIEQCHQLLLLASDKGHAIANEGTDLDRHNITDQLNALRAQLESIKKNVEIEQDKYQKQRIYHKNVSKDILKLLEWFRLNKDIIKSRPLYSDDLKISSELISDNEKLCSHARNKISQICDLLNKLKYESQLPDDLKEYMEEADQLNNSIPNELISRDLYFKQNHSHRLAYHDKLSKVEEWVKKFENQVPNQFKFNMNIVLIDANLTELFTFVKDETDMKNLLYHDIQDQAELFWNTLTESDQEKCLLYHQNLKTRMSEASHKAALRQTELLANKDLLQQHKAYEEKIVTCLQKYKLGDSMLTLPTLPARTNHINELLDALLTEQQELNTFNDLTSKIINQTDPSVSDKVNKLNLEINGNWADNITLLENVRENLNQLQHQWKQLESILLELETKLNCLLEKDQNLDLTVRSQEEIVSKKQKIQILLEDKAALNDLNLKANSLAKTLIIALQEQQLKPYSLEDKLNHLNQVDSKLTENLKIKQKQLQDKAHELQLLIEQVTNLCTEIERTSEKLIKLNPFDERLQQTEKTITAIKHKIDEYQSRKGQLREKISENYLPSQQFIPTDLTKKVDLLQTLLNNLIAAMDKCNINFKRAKTVRTDYFLVYDKIKTWIENAELTITNHNIDPSELKTKLVALVNSEKDIQLAHEQFLAYGNEIVQSSPNSDDKFAMQANVDQITFELNKTIQLVEDKNQTVDQILGNWANFMRVYQLVIDWSIKLRALLERKLQLNTLYEAQLACQNYSSAVSSIADVSQNLSEMNQEFDKINEVCSTGYLKNKLNEAETLKTDIETVLFERNLFLHETTEEWQQYENKIESVKTWIQDSYQTLNSSELKSKTLRDQLRILEQMLADISAQKIKVNMSLEKLQVHFHSEIIYSDNSNIVHNGRTTIGDLEKLNKDVFQTTQNLEKALTQIEDCQNEMQGIRQRIVQEEQQLRNILSPLHQSSDSDKTEQECRERIRALQSHLNQINAKIKLLLQRGTPE